MTDNELQLLRDRHSEIETEKKLLKETKEMIFTLEKEPSVQKYLSLIRIIAGQENIDYDEKMMSMFMNILKDTKNSNLILFDYGVQEIYTGEDTSFQEPIKAQHHIYQDIETNKIYYKGYNQILPGDESWIFNAMANEELTDLSIEYDEIQKQFFEGIITQSQEEVIEELFKKNKRLVKGK